MISPTVIHLKVKLEFSLNLFAAKLFIVATASKEEMVTTPPILVQPLKIRHCYALCSVGSCIQSSTKLEFHVFDFVTVMVTSNHKTVIITIL